MSTVVQKTPSPLARMDRINTIDAVSPPHYRENQQILSSWDEERGVQFVRLSLSLPFSAVLGVRWDTNGLLPFLALIQEGRGKSLSTSSTPLGPPTVCIEDDGAFHPRKST